MSDSELGMMARALLDELTERGHLEVAPYGEQLLALGGLVAGGKPSLAAALADLAKAVKRPSRRFVFDADGQPIGIEDAAS